tara:strand:- start:671 stop:1234 length:564 start_codon:yes stop_codon:yes gene_type:complete
MKVSELSPILERIGKTTDDFDLFIETGSYMGETLGNMKSVFNKLVSIEITDKYYNYCCNKFANDKNVELVKGDCLLELPKLIEKFANSRILFYLDGHYSAGDTGKNHLDVPLIEELKLINELYNKEALIIVDDSDLFEFTNQDLSWSGINEENILNILGNRVISHFYMNNMKPYEEKKRLIIEIKNK